MKNLTLKEVIKIAKEINETEEELMMDSLLDEAEEDEDTKDSENTPEEELDTPEEEPDMGEKPDMGEEPDMGDEALTGDKAEIQDALTKAIEAAKNLGDEKLIQQLGNTITFFTRSHVVGNATQNLEELNEEQIKWNKIAGIDLIKG